MAKSNRDQSKSGAKAASIKEALQHNEDAVPASPLPQGGKKPQPDYHAIAELEDELGGPA